MPINYPLHYSRFLFPLSSIMQEFQQFQNWLKGVSFLTAQDCALFEPHLKLKRFKEKELFIAEGKVCREIAFINSGSFRTYYLSESKEINTCFYFENQFVVEYDSFLKAMPSRYYIQALEDSEVVCFSLPAVQNAYKQSHNRERFGRIMAEEAYKMTAQRVESFLFLDGEQRYLQLMETEPWLFDRVPLYLIASYLGLERESISRLRKKIAQR